MPTTSEKTLLLGLTHTKVFTFDKLEKVKSLYDSLEGGIADSFALVRDSYFDDFRGFSIEDVIRIAGNMMDELISDGINFFVYSDETYPSQLLSVANPPSLLFYRGNPELLVGGYKALGCVGSRAITAPVKSVIKTTFEGLPSVPITVISGLAVGVDEYSHRCALDRGYNCVGVLGSPLNNEMYYPRETVSLRDEILDKGGLVITEYYKSHPTRPYHFSLRNRIVAALSDAVIVFQASKKSGSVITGRYACESEKPCLVVTGLPYDKRFAGCIDLIDKGAIAFTGHDQIATVLKWQTQEGFAVSQSKPKPELSKTEQSVLETLSLDAAVIESIITKTNLSLSEVTLALSKLELKGLVRAAGSNQWIVA